MKFTVLIIAVCVARVFAKDGLSHNLRRGVREQLLEKHLMKADKKLVERRTKRAELHSRSRSHCYAGCIDTDFIDTTGSILEDPIKMYAYDQCTEKQNEAIEDAEKELEDYMANNVEPLILDLETLKTEFEADTDSIYDCLDDIDAKYREWGCSRSIVEDTVASEETDTGPTCTTTIVDDQWGGKTQGVTCIGQNPAPLPHGKWPCTSTGVMACATGLTCMIRSGSNAGKSVPGVRTYGYAPDDANVCYDPTLDTMAKYLEEMAQARACLPTVNDAGEIILADGTNLQTSKSNILAKAQEIVSHEDELVEREDTLEDAMSIDCVEEAAEADLGSALTLAWAAVSEAIVDFLEGIACDLIGVAISLFGGIIDTALIATGITAGFVTMPWYPFMCSPDMADGDALDSKTAADTPHFPMDDMREAEMFNLRKQTIEEAPEQYGEMMQDAINDVGATAIYAGFEEVLQELKGIVINEYDKTKLDLTDWDVSTGNDGFGLLEKGASTMLSRHQKFRRAHEERRLKRAEAGITPSGETRQFMFEMIWQLAIALFKESGIQELEDIAESPEIAMAEWVIMRIWDGICGRFGTALMEVVAQVVYCNLCNICKEDACVIKAGGESVLTIDAVTEALGIYAPDKKEDGSDTDSNNDGKNTCKEWFSSNSVSDELDAASDGLGDEISPVGLLQLVDASKVMLTSSKLGSAENAELLQKARRIDAYRTLRQEHVENGGDEKLLKTASKRGKVGDDDYNGVYTNERRSWVVKGNTGSEPCDVFCKSYYLGYWKEFWVHQYHAEAGNEESEVFESGYIDHDKYFMGSTGAVHIPIEFPENDYSRVQLYPESVRLPLTADGPKHTTGMGSVPCCDSIGAAEHGATVTCEACICECKYDDVWCIALANALEQAGVFQMNPTQAPTPMPPSYDSSIDCFPSDATVESPSGRKVRMDELTVGDKVRTAHGFSEIYAFGDDDTSVLRSPYLSLRTDQNTSLLLSPDHIVMVGISQWPTKASAVSTGDLVWAADLTDTGSNSVFRPATIVDVELHFDWAGVHAPLTMDGTIVVDGILASCYAGARGGKVLAAFSISSHTMAHTFTWPLRVMYATFGSDDPFGFGWNNCGRGRHCFIEFILWLARVVQPIGGGAGLLSALIVAAVGYGARAAAAKKNRR